MSSRLSRALAATLPDTRKAVRQKKIAVANGVYKIWLGMRDRCYHAYCTGYENYGGRGIRMCVEWFDNPDRFATDMGPRPSPKHTLERNDNDGNYEPENCRWATWTEQANNRRHSAQAKLITFRGETLSMGGWARRIGLSRGVVWARLNQGWSTEDALTVPPQRGRGSGPGR
jgi:hypothetical protein